MKFDLDKPLPALPVVSDAKLDLFFGYLSTTNRIRYSAIMAGLEPSQVARVCKADPVLAERKLAARQEYCERVEAEIHRRAIDGVPRGVWFKGRQVGTEIAYSDKLLELLAKANMQKYRDRLEVEANVKAGVLVVQTSLDPAEWEKMYGKADPDEERTDDRCAKSVTSEVVDAG